MFKPIGIVLAAIICVCCTSIEKQNRFPNVEMSPLFIFQNMDEMENVVLKVEGKIPHWLQGQFVRNGPALIKAKNGLLKSWFDGLGKLYAFTIDEGKVTFSCKFLRSEAYTKFQATGEFDFVGFAQQPQTDTFSFTDLLFDVSNKELTNANVNVSKINNHLIALTEIPLPVEFDKSLNTLRPFDYEDALPKNYSFESAHILMDPRTKEMWNFIIKIGLLDTNYLIYHIPYLSSERKLIASIPVSSVSYMHSFSLAGKYFVLIDYPLRAKNPKKMAHGFIEALSWFKNEKSVVYLIDRETGHFWSLCAPPFFSFHHINGFEKDGKVFVDLIAYPNPDIIYKVNKYPFVKNPNNRVWRLTIDPIRSKVNIGNLTYTHVEFPRINEYFIGQSYQYFYAVHIQPSGNGIIKFNLIEPRHSHWFQDGSFANEPVFVPHPNARSEDDGVILTIINNLTERKSFLLILNAKDLKELARIKAPQFIPFGFHGQFF